METLVYLGWVQPGSETLRRGEPTEVTVPATVRPNGKLARDSAFIRTLGCGADRLTIGIDGQTLLLEHHNFRALGTPVVYFNEAEPLTAVRIHALKRLYSVEFKATECTQHYVRVRVEVSHKGATRTVMGTAVNDCG